MTIEDVPRILWTGSGIRYRGAVHEYLWMAGSPDGSVDLVNVQILLHHDGYDESVVDVGHKRSRNLELLSAAIEDEPCNPRWLYFLIRDGLPTLSRTRLLEICSALKSLVDSAPATGDRLSARHYYRRAAWIASQALAAIGDWRAVRHFCDEFDRLDGDSSPDSHYLRSIEKLVSGCATESDLVHTIQMRRDSQLVSRSVIDPYGRNLDVLIMALLRSTKRNSAADRYSTFCDPWSDALFTSSGRLHGGYRDATEGLSTNRAWASTRSVGQPLQLGSGR